MPNDRIPNVIGIDNALFKRGRLAKYESWRPFLREQDGMKAHWPGQAGRRQHRR